MKWPEEYINQIICGDCLEVIKTMPDNCIDTIITDPPYGIGFMGKEWDNFKDGSNTKKRWVKRNEYYIKREIYTSLDSSPAMKAGSYDLSPKGLIGFQEWMLGIVKEMLRVAKPGSTLLCFGGTRTFHRLACVIEDAGWILKDCVMWLYGSGFPKATDISKNLDKMASKKREVIGKYELPDVADGKRKKGWECTNTTDVGVFGVSGQQDITAPATPKATLWNGWKSHGLKPAYEPILVAMKPNEGSYANNALKWGVAGLNINGGRITLNGDKPRKADLGKSHTNTYGWAKGGINKSGEMPAKGRYPANVIIDNSLEVKKEFDKYKTSGNSYRPTGSRGRGIINGNIPFNKGLKRKGDILGFNDSGNPSRFFYCAKASKAERNRGCEELEEKERANINKIMGKAGNFKTGSGNDRNEKFRNNHPTVKPLALMKYLCKLTKTPMGGILLDPFCGSGTTLMACKELKRDYIGIDNNLEYCEIARRRINATPEPLF